MSGPRHILEALESADLERSRTLARVAAFIRADPGQAVMLPIEQLAHACDTSPSSVVRLATSLGYSGYRELRSALREELAYSRGRDTTLAGGNAAAASDLASDIDPEDSLTEVVAKIAFADSRAVADTAAGLDLEALARVRDACLRARDIVTFGVGASAFAAMDLQQKFSRIGMRATSHVDAHQGLPAASLLTPEDVAVGISHSGSTWDVLDALTIAKAQGARTIAITNAPASDLARVADLLLLTDAHESPMRSGATASRIAQLTLVDVVFIAVAQQRMDQARSSLQRTYTALASRRG
ncbi:MAG: MurR/RpiR family transcriptional regulator [Dermabacter sp.]|nr:MurR/RpiR family transcriptional regulator [Dermabacter sp.]